MAVLLLSGFLRVVPPSPTGYLDGSTKIAGLPDVAVQRLVQLVTAANAHGQVFPYSNVVAWKWSAPDGSWRFDGLDPAQKYHAIAYDHTGQYDPVVKLNLVPSVP